MEFNTYCIIDAKFDFEGVIFYLKRNILKLTNTNIFYMWLHQKIKTYIKSFFVTHVKT